MKKILVVTPFLPYPNVPHAGGLSVFKSLEKLSKDFDVTLLCRYDKSEEKHLKDAEKLCNKLYALPFFEGNVLKKIKSYFILSRVAQALCDEKDFDLIEINNIETGIGIKKIKQPSVVIAHDVITKPAKREFENAQGAEKLKPYIKYIVTKYFEKKICKKFDMVFTMSEIDNELLEEMDKKIKTRVSTNLLGVDFTETNNREIKEEIVFLGAMNRSYNEEGVLFFLENILPEIRKKHSNVVFNIVGNKPSEKVKQMAQKYENVNVTGFVEDPFEYLNSAKVFISPLFVGGGIIVKNLHAMSHFVPLVTTTIGNEGIGAKDNKQVLIADNKKEFIEKTLKVLEDESFALELARNAYNFVKENYSDDVLYSKRIKIYKELVNG